MTADFNNIRTLKKNGAIPSKLSVGITSNLEFYPQTNNQSK